VPRPRWPRILPIAVWSVRKDNDAHALAAASADQRVDLVDLGDQPGPARGAALPRLLRVRDRLVGRRRLGGASGALGVLAVEESAGSAMSPWIQSSPGSRSRARAACRVRQRTHHPFRTSAGLTAPPTKPVAPVSRSEPSVTVIASASHPARLSRTGMQDARRTP
jgi:hypothetical protein